MTQKLELQTGEVKGLLWVKTKEGLRHQAEKQAFHVGTVGPEGTHVEDCFVFSLKKILEGTPQRNTGGNKKGEDVRNRN